MNRIDQIQALRTHLDNYRANNQTIALVPTMGNLHAGHLSLVDEARKHADRVIVSIFVNPAQFDREDDLAAYPRTLEADLAALEEKAVDVVFCPDAKEVYPAGRLVTEVDVPPISALLEGASRPGHFRGVATVVCKLLNIVGPDVAIFGEKDFQQLMLIRQMVADLNMPVQIVGVPTMREPDGLAMSSRNNRLSREQRQLAPEFSRVLRELVAAVQAGEDDYTTLQAQSCDELSELGFKPDYVKVCDATSLLPADEQATELVVLGAAYAGDIRLIDNIAFTSGKTADG